jgi:DNA-3-methyladenine glycosylase II
VGIQLLKRLAADRGRATPDGPDGPRAFPDPEELASRTQTTSTATAISSTKARTIIAIAQAVVADRLDLEGLQRLEDGAAIERLTSLRGIGRWTAEYVLLRGLGRLHVFPGDDVGAHNKLRRLFGIDTPLDYDAVHRLVERWHPYAGVSTSTCSSTRCRVPASWIGPDADPLPWPSGIEGSRDGPRATSAR